MRSAATRADRHDDAEPIDSVRTITGRATRPRLLILGDNESEVVHAAGGLIYDRSSGGWDVEVQLTASGDGRPLQILGATSTSLADLDISREGSQWPDAIIVSPHVYRDNIAVRDYFTRALLRSQATTAMYGDDWPAGLGKDIGRVAYQLGPAARAFKRQAMLAAGLTPAPTASAEALRGCRREFASHRLVAAPPV